MGLFKKSSGPAATETGESGGTATVTADEKPAEKPAPKKEAPVAETREKPRRGREAAKKVAAGTAVVRNRIASIVWLVAVVCALLLAVGALLIALKANQGNGIVNFVLGAADQLDLEVFSRKHGIFTFDGTGASVKNALVNWGIGAVAYLVVGKVLDRIIRP